MRLLCTADLHLGRRSSLPDECRDGRRHACAEAWLACVELARREQVAAVLLAGDLIDQENQRYEARGPFETGLRRLAEAGISALAVAGNHDGAALGQVFDLFDPGLCRLVGRGGHWERVVLTRDGERLAIDGFSFARREQATSPLASYDLPPAEGPVLGLVHADLDARGSACGPVTLAELRARPVAGWVLGHVHRPRLLAEAAPGVLYPGSPQALDAGETGAHGPWLASVSPGGAVAWEQVPLSSVRYETVTVDLDGVEAEAVAEGRVHDALRAALGEVAPTGPAWLVCRLRLVGRTPLHRRAEALLAPAVLNAELPRQGETRAVVERVESATRPAWDLAARGAGHDPVAVLARLLLDLESGAGDADLLAAAGERLATVHAASVVAPVREPAPAPDAARAGLLAQGYRLLDALLGQGEGR
jgi:predicted phosphodiesterase